MDRLWSLMAWGLAALVAAPLLVVLSAFVAPAGDAWPHLRATVLADYVANTLALVLAVGLVAGLIGVATAWTVASRSFPGRRVLAWALVLPLAAPGYVTAYVYTDLLEFSGPLQTALRGAGWNGTLPPIRSLGGAVLVLGLVLYPYVYLLARRAFATQAGALFEAARALGAGPARAFATIALPAARPAIVGGMALAMMEAVADYGVVEYFGVATFTTGIFRTWFAMGDRGAAMQLAAWLFSLAALLILAERAARRGRVGNPVARSATARPVALTGWRGWLATLGCSLPVVLGFVAPLVVLARHAILVGDPLLGQGFGEFARASAGVAGASALLATGVALVLAYAERLSRHPATALAVRTATLGYALPGAMLAVGLLAPLTAIDKFLARGLATHFDISVPLLLTGTVGALVFAYVARFLTVAYNACHSGLERIHLRLDDAARSLGAGPGRTLREVHVPLMGGAVASGILLVFIDVMKELPATLILRPFNFETLATRTYRLASDERLAEASTAALTLLVLGILPAILLAATSARRSGG